MTNVFRDIVPLISGGGFDDCKTIQDSNLVSVHFFLNHLNIDAHFKGSLRLFLDDRS